MAKWPPFPHAGSYRFDAAGLRQQWARLHTGDAEPLPQDPAVLQAWVLLHNGAFEQAVQAGLAAGSAGTTVANKAAAIYAHYLEPQESQRLDLFMEIAQRAEEQAAQEPANANAWYLHAYALARYGQGISVAKALAQGLGTKTKESLQKAIALSPRHADARIALGAFHARVIDKVGPLIGQMTYGVHKNIALQLIQEALRLHPGSAVAMVEYANALLILEGDGKMEEAHSFYEQAAASTPLDALEHLEVEMARLQLAN